MVALNKKSEIKPTAFVYSDLYTYCPYSKVYLNMCSEIGPLESSVHKAPIKQCNKFQVHH